MRAALSTNPNRGTRAVYWGVMIFRPREGIYPIRKWFVGHVFFLSLSCGGCLFGSFRVYYRAGFTATQFCSIPIICAGCRVLVLSCVLSATLCCL
ncbi:hypothetical protein BKA67DRAFT_554509 [Truncatella angustata]|uniref:Uncharacterized protein n=1 Tax=Truncatella angustata TaxID=152316 RepID=A0A9P8ZZF3_9PEZI|nr:uncharacterized protein BKA67DRAFT_554509 [Truncatella angustata]KAH6657182.1 hypothetical protein BKA67DRAFT_554509 [Truncatella angustata]